MDAELLHHQWLLCRKCHVMLGHQLAASPKIWFKMDKIAFRLQMPWD